MNKTNNKSIRISNTFLTDMMYKNKLCRYFKHGRIYIVYGHNIFKIYPQLKTLRQNCIVPLKNILTSKKIDEMTAKKRERFNP